MIAAFLLIVAGVPLLQVAFEVAAGKRPQVLDVFNLSLHKSSLHEWEEDLEKSSIAKGVFQPRVQALITGVGGFGNTNAVAGRDGWLFYNPGIEYIGGPGILDPTRIDQHDRKLIAAGDRSPRSDPRAAVVQFNEQCKALGVHLVLVPIPDKAGMQPAELSARFQNSGSIPPLNNADFTAWRDEMRRAGVDIFDCTPERVMSDENHFLVQDTHWNPVWMTTVARDPRAPHEAVALPHRDQPSMKIKSGQARRVGDLTDMLRLSADQTLLPPNGSRLNASLTPTGGRGSPKPPPKCWSSATASATSYSLESMGWGDSAGFVEHLSYEMGRDVDRITRNDAGAFATRQMLAADLAREKNRLAGKKVVVWEFARARADQRQLENDRDENGHASRATIRDRAHRCEPDRHGRRRGGCPRADARQGPLPRSHRCGAPDGPRRRARPDRRRRSAGLHVEHARQRVDPRCALPTAPDQKLRVTLRPWSAVLGQARRHQPRGARRRRAQPAGTLLGRGDSTMTPFYRAAIFSITGLVTVSSVIHAADASPGAAESFRAKCAELADAAEKRDSLAVAGKEGWLFLTKELRHLGVGKFWGAEAAAVTRATKPEQADPLPGNPRLQGAARQGGDRTAARARALQSGRLPRDDRRQERGRGTP